MRLKKLLFVSIALIATYSIGWLFQNFTKINVAWNGFVVLFIVLGFELIRKELLALRRAMNLSLNDNEIEAQIAEKEYQIRQADKNQIS